LFKQLGNGDGFFLSRSTMPVTMAIAVTDAPVCAAGTLSDPEPTAMSRTCAAANRPDPLER
jgi:uncharacterized membrane protein YhhN